MIFSFLIFSYSKLSHRLPPCSIAPPTHSHSWQTILKSCAVGDLMMKDWPQTVFIPQPSKSCSECCKLPGCKSLFPPVFSRERLSWIMAKCSPLGCFELTTLIFCWKGFQSLLSLPIHWFCLAIMSPGSCLRLVFLSSVFRRAIPLDFRRLGTCHNFLPINFNWGSPFVQSSRSTYRFDEFIQLLLKDHDYHCLKRELT